MKKNLGGMPMSYRVVQGDILLQQTDAVAISIEIDFSPSEMPS